MEKVTLPNGAEFNPEIKTLEGQPAGVALWVINAMQNKPTGETMETAETDKLKTRPTSRFWEKSGLRLTQELEYLTPVEDRGFNAIKSVFFSIVKI